VGLGAGWTGRESESRVLPHCRTSGTGVEMLRCAESMVLQTGRLLSQSNCCLCANWARIAPSPVACHAEAALGGRIRTELRQHLVTVVPLLPFWQIHATFNFDAGTSPIRLLRLVLVSATLKQYSVSGECSNWSPLLGLHRLVAHCLTRARG
jgi:hypothetical protein